jgi:nitrogen-specific signal transduction histidine kinase
MVSDQGFDSTEELLMASKDSFDSMIRNAIRSAPAGVSFVSLSVRRLGAFKYCAKERYICGLPSTAQLFTNEVMNDYLLLMRADEIEVAAKAGQVPIKPDSLKTEKDWFKFWEKLKNNLGRIRGAARLPLIYVVRDHDEVTDKMR